MRSWLSKHVSMLWALVGLTIAVVLGTIVVPQVQESLKPQPLATFQTRELMPEDVRTVMSLENAGNGALFRNENGEIRGRIVEGPDGEFWAYSRQSREATCLASIAYEAYSVLECGYGDWPMVLNIDAVGFVVDKDVQIAAAEQGVTRLLLIYTREKLEVWPLDPDDASR